MRTRILISNSSWYLVPLLGMILVSQGCIGMEWIGDVVVEQRQFPLPPGMSMELAAKPERIEKDNSSGREAWIYPKEGARWVGPVFLVIIPIPVLLPVGQNYVAVVFEDGKPLTWARHSTDIKWGGACGLFFNLHDAANSRFHCKDLVQFSRYARP